VEDKRTPFCLTPLLAAAQNLLKFTQKCHNCTANNYSRRIKILEKKNIFFKLSPRITTNLSTPSPPTDGADSFNIFIILGYLFINTRNPRFVQVQIQINHSPDCLT
jgi:hypothetical protein